MYARTKLSGYTFADVVILNASQNPGTRLYIVALFPGRMMYVKLGYRLRDNANWVRCIFGLPLLSGYNSNTRTRVAVICKQTELDYF